MVRLPQIYGSYLDSRVANARVVQQSAEDPSVPDGCDLRPRSEGISQTSHSHGDDGVGA